MRPGYENKTQERTENLVIGWTLKWYNSANKEKLTLRARSRRRAARGRRVLEKNCRRAPTVCCFKMGSNHTRDLRRSAPSSSRGSKTKSWSGPIAATAAPTALWSCRMKNKLTFEWCKFSTYNRPYHLWVAYLIVHSFEHCSTYIKNNAVHWLQHLWLNI